MEETIQTLFENITWDERLNAANNVMQPIVNAINEELLGTYEFDYVFKEMQEIAARYIDEHFPAMKGRYKLRHFVFPVPEPPRYVS